MGPIDLWTKEANGIWNHLLANILQNIFCVPLKKESNTGLEWHEDK